MWSLPIILLVSAVSYALCNVRSGNVFTRAICPMVFTLSLVSLAVWIYLKASASDWRGGDGGGSSSSSGDTTGPPSGNDAADAGSDGDGGGGGDGGGD